MNDLVMSCSQGRREFIIEPEGCGILWLDGGLVCILKVRTSFFEPLLDEVQVEMTEYWKEDGPKFGLILIMRAVHLRRI